MLPEYMLGACSKGLGVLPRVRGNCFSIVIRTIDNTLLLIFLQYPRNDCLGNYTDPMIVHHSCPKCVQPLYVNRRVCLQQSNMENTK